MDTQDKEKWASIVFGKSYSKTEYSDEELENASKDFIIEQREIITKNLNDMINAPSSWMVKKKTDFIAARLDVLGELLGIIPAYQEQMIGGIVKIVNMGIELYHDNNDENNLSWIDAIEALDALFND